MPASPRLALGAGGRGVKKKKKNLWISSWRTAVTVFMGNKSTPLCWIDPHSSQTCRLERSPHFVVERVTSPHGDEGWWFPDAAWMSGWGGLWSMYVSRTEREGWGMGGGGVSRGALVPTETWEQETHALHFLSPLYQHLALLFLCC